MHIPYRDYKYSFRGTLISSLAAVLCGIIAVLVIQVIIARVSGNQVGLTNIGFLDSTICICILGMDVLIYILLNKIAEAVVRKSVLQKIRTKWEFADRFSLDHPEYLDFCKNENPEFAQKRLEREEREKKQDLLLQQTVDKIKAERAKKYSVSE